MSTHGHAADSGWSPCRREPRRIDVAADGDDVAIHALQIAGDRDFLDRICNAPVLDPEARAPRE
jgi:hypothetical protein